MTRFDTRLSIEVLKKWRKENIQCHFFPHFVLSCKPSQANLDLAKWMSNIHVEESYLLRIIFNINFSIHVWMHLCKMDFMENAASVGTIKAIIRCLWGHTNKVIDFVLCIQTPFNNWYWCPNSSLNLNQIFYLVY